MFELQYLYLFYSCEALLPNTRINFIMNFTSLRDSLTIVRYFLLLVYIFIGIRIETTGWVRQMFQSWYKTMNHQWQLIVVTDDIMVFIMIQTFVGLNRSYLALSLPIEHCQQTMPPTNIYWYNIYFSINRLFQSFKIVMDEPLRHGHCIA